MLWNNASGIFEMGQICSRNVRPLFVALIWPCKLFLSVLKLITDISLALSGATFTLDSRAQITFISNSYNCEEWSHYNHFQNFYIKWCSKKTSTFKFWLHNISAPMDENSKILVLTPYNTISIMRGRDKNCKVLMTWKRGDAKYKTDS
jgi:hypothetical protein